jgi:hypothetical protein
MSESFAERLSRFTPDAGKLDRDALLFAAGRASAHPGRRWKALAGALAASQLLTLVFFLWPQTPPAVAPAPPGPATAGGPTGPSVAPDPSSASSLRERMFAVDANTPAAASGDSLVPDEPPLRAFGASSSTLMD